MHPSLDCLSTREVLLAVEENRRKELCAGAELLALAAHWCDLHGQVSFDEQARVIPGAEVLVRLGGPGTPEVEEFAAAEFAVMRGQHPMAARSLMADALDLRHRLPRVWAAVHELRIPAWVARKIASLTHHLNIAAVGFVDRAIAPYLDTLTPGRLFALVEAKILEADPDAADAARKAAEEARFVRSTKEEHGLKTLIARAKAGEVIVFEAMVNRIAEILAERGDADLVDVRRSRAIGILAHPAEALRMLLQAAVEADDTADVTVPTDDESPDRAVHARGLVDLLKALGPAAAGAARPQVKLFVHLSQAALGKDFHSVGRVEGIGPILTEQLRDWLAHAEVTMTAVLDLDNQRPVDGYEFPERLKTAVHLLRPAGVFPYATETSRRKDIDHPVPYCRGGPPGQTSLTNAAPLTRHQHRTKTHGGWTLHQQKVGVYLWRTPHGFWFKVDRNGTHRVDPRLEKLKQTYQVELYESPLEHSLAS